MFHIELNILIEIIILQVNNSRENLKCAAIRESTKLISRHTSCQYNWSLMDARFSMDFFFSNRIFSDEPASLPKC